MCIRDRVGTGVEGAIMGKALYAGRFTLEQALLVSRGVSVEDAVRQSPTPAAE